MCPEKNILMCIWFENTLQIISQRARNRFNQVVEAKTFEGVFLC